MQRKGRKSEIENIKQRTKEKMKQKRVDEANSEINDFARMIASCAKFQPNASWTKQEATQDDTCFSEHQLVDGNVYSFFCPSHIKEPFQLHLLHKQGSTTPSYLIAMTGERTLAVKLEQHSFIIIYGRDPNEGFENLAIQLAKLQRLIDVEDIGLGIQWRAKWTAKEDLQSLLNAISKISQNQPITKNNNQEDKKEDPKEGEKQTNIEDINGKNINELYEYINKGEPKKKKKKRKKKDKTGEQNINQKEDQKVDEVQTSTNNTKANENLIGTTKEYYTYPMENTMDKIIEEGPQNQRQNNIEGLLQQIEQQNNIEEHQNEGVQEAPNNNVPQENLISTTEENLINTAEEQMNQNVVEEPQIEQPINNDVQQNANNLQQNVEAHENHPNYIVKPWYFNIAGGNREYDHFLQKAGQYYNTEQMSPEQIYQFAGPNEQTQQNQTQQTPLSLDAKPYIPQYMRK